MNNKKLHNKNDVYLAQWMEGELSDDELRDRVSEEDFSMYRKMKNGMCVLEELQQPLTSSFEAIQKKIELRKSIKRRRKVIGWGMSIAASLIIIFGLYTMFNPLTTKIETSFAEQRTISLLDGSEVIINARSEISYDEKDWSENRMISLNGEAFFKVEKGSTFTVNTSLGSELF